MPNTDFNNIFSFGQGYNGLLASNIQNPFWKAVLRGWTYFCDKLIIGNDSQVLNSPLWYNPNLNRAKLYNIKHWLDKGIKTMADLTNENGRLLQFEDLKQRFKIRGTFLDYQNLLAKISNEWKDWISNNRPFCILNKYYVSCNFYVQQ